MDQRGAPSPPGLPPTRWLAIAGAATVTMLAVSGAVGLVPGVALGESPPPGQVQADGAGTDGAPADDATDDGATDDAAPTGDEAAAPPETSADPSESDSGGSDADGADGAPADASPPDGLGTTPDGSGNDPGPASSEATTDVPLPDDSGQGTRIVYDISAQRVWLVRRGAVSRTYPVSGARETTKIEPGDYQVYSMSREAVAFDYKETMRFMVRFTHGETAPIGFHDIPRDLDGDPVQTRAQLGTPLSAGCIRQWRRDAVALWQFSDIGTPVVVLA